MNYTIAVRALCEFTARRGDLDLRFTPSPSAQEGMQGHMLVASRRPGHYESEVSLSGTYKHLLVRGRADGYDSALNRLEEVKTFRGDIERIKDNHRRVHWAQAKVYGHLLCGSRGLKSIDIALVYFDVASQQETVLTETHTADALAQFFAGQCEDFLQWSEREMAHRAARDAALAALVFPHAQFRPGQRELAEAVYQTASKGRCLMAQAPTGIGKTVGTLFPLLKACATQQLDKVFFLSAKTSGRALALGAVATINTVPLRTLELVAREKSCEHPDKACHGESCPLARGFYDRLPQARAAAVQQHAILDKALLRQTALDHAVCPYYLGQELARWADVVVGDYNYYFDTSAMLHALTTTSQWKVGVLVDEAHNMVERARGMYSAALEPMALAVARRAAPALVRSALDRLARTWDDLHSGNPEGEAPPPAYEVRDTIPEELTDALRLACSAMSEHFAAHPAQTHGELQAFFFEALHFARMADSFGTHSLFDITRDITRDGGGALLTIRNVVPAPFLRARFAAARSVTLFSATLTPQSYYADTLGLPKDTAWIDVASPFDSVQLGVHIAGRISTRYHHRGRSLEPIAQLMARQFDTAPGNYLAFVSSYDYLERLAGCFRRLHPEVPVWEQQRGMGERERDAFLARFTPTSQGIGFAVLGGAFAEGIDLPGERLVGAFVATLGLPQVNPVNEQIRLRMEQSFGAGSGYDYTYLYPGIQKVVQAAGRVIRTQLDRGVVHLIDDRFARPEVMALLPAWWQVQHR